jgi:dienelactone hydrolase
LPGVECALVADLSRERLVELLGDHPVAAPLEPRVEERVELDGIVRERVSYQVEPGERAPAYLFVPPGAAGPHAAILCLHQHNGQFELGKSEPAGLAGNPEQHYALELARRGYVTLAADQLCFEERRDSRLDGGAFERFEFVRRISLGSSLQAKYSLDAMRAVDYLLTRPEVDATRIACIGHSLGGQQALFLAALDTRIAAGVSSCGFASLATIFRDAVNHNFAAYVPGLLREGDLGDVLGLVAPRPFFACVGVQDRIFPFDGVKASIARAHRVYRARGVGDRLVLETEPGGHAFTDRLRRLAYTALDRWLGVTQ